MNVSSSRTIQGRFIRGRMFPCKDKSKHYESIDISSNNHPNPK